MVVLVPKQALAVPVFANGQGVSCEACHTTFPGMTRPTADPNVWSEEVHFSMAGPWTIEVQYGKQAIDEPIQVGAEQ